MAEKEQVRKEEIMAVMAEEFPKLVESSPAFRHQLLGMLTEYFVKNEDLKLVLDAIKDLREDFNTRFDEHSRILGGHSQVIKELLKSLDRHEKRLDKHEKRLDTSIRGLWCKMGDNE